VKRRKTKSLPDPPAKAATYAAARADAQARADDTGYDHGLEWLGYWSIFMLPRRESRFGRDMNCEAVMCSDLARCQHGHGPVPCLTRPSRED
jgi:hypothetical protein